MADHVIRPELAETQFTFLKAPAAKVPSRIRLGLDLTRTTSSVGSLSSPTLLPAEKSPTDTSVPVGNAGYNRPFDAIANTQIRGGPSQMADRQSVPRVPLPSGHILHKYRIEGLIGEGGFALTYEAVEPTLGRAVAIKELLMSEVTARHGVEDVGLIHGDDDVETYEWIKFFFSREAQITFGLRHEGIVRMFEFFKKNNTAYIVYEYLQGQTLQDWCKKKNHKISQAEMMRFIDRSSRALSYIHRSGILHRDIKPENIMLELPSDAPILIDFGAAIELGRNELSGIPVITKGFSPPEQYVHDSRQDERADIYAYCATLYWMLSGERPIEAIMRSDQDSLVPIHDRIEPPFLQSHRLCDAIMRGLSIDVSKRQRNVAEFLDEVFPKISLANTGYEAKPRGDKIFLSYRRSDSAHFAGRLLDFLEMRFGSGSVFFDIESIPLGVDFWDHIKSVLSECAAVVVVIGPNWLDQLRANRRRWYSPHSNRDFVASEIQAASALKLPVIPVLFDGTAMPTAKELPSQIAFLPNLNASLIGDGRAFRGGVDGVCDQIAKLRKSFWEQEHFDASGSE